VIGGTGDYFGATGQMSVRDITDPNDPTAPTTSLYEADLVLPRG
jgi:hypothetical protein